MVATKAHYENLYSLDGNKQYVVGKKDDQFILLDDEPFKTAPPFNFEG